MISLFPEPQVWACKLPCSFNGAILHKYVLGTGLKVTKAMWKGKTLILHLKFINKVLKMHFGKKGGKKNKVRADPWNLPCIYDSPSTLTCLSVELL